MVCIQCQNETQVINSRLQKRSNQVWRRRKCSNCSSIITTHEAADYNAAWRVKSKTQALVPFDRDKLFLSLYKSLQHRPTAITDATGITDTVIKNLLTVQRSGLLQPEQITETVVTSLTRFDTAASIHYQAFHKK